MPAVSQAQQEMMGADLARARRGQKTRTGMSVSQLEDFAHTPRKGLPAHVGKPKHHAKGRHVNKHLARGYR